MPDEAPQAQYEIDPTNHAADAAVAARALAYIQPLCQQARGDRDGLDQGWRELYNIWDCTTDIRWYRGRADVYFPAGHRAIERATSKQLARLFPSGDDCVDVQPVPPGSDTEEVVQQDLDAAKALIWYDLHQQIKIRKRFGQFLRQLNTLGTSVWATDYVTAEEVAGQRRLDRGRLTRHPAQGVIATPTTDLSSVGPSGRPVDLFTWYVYPTTVSSLADATVVFEDQLVSGVWIRRQRDRGRLVVTEEQLAAHKGKAPDRSIWAASSRMQARGTGEAADAYVVTMAYAVWHPSAEGADHEEAVPFQFVLLNDAVMLCARQNPWWSQSPPYEAARLYPWVDEFYGRGLLWFTRKLQYLLNDTANQTFDAISYSLNPLAAVDPALVPDPSLLQYRPGAKWPVPPTAISWMRPPDVSGTGFMAIRQIWEIIQESSGAATGGQYLPTLGVARGAETATGQSLLIAQADLDVAHVVAGIEEDVLEPLCGRLDSLEQQFLPQGEERILRALGPKGLPLLRHGMRIRREQMAGTRTYTWTGGVVSDQKEQIQKAGPELLKILFKVPDSPDVKIKRFEFLRNVYRSFGFADADDIIQIRQRGAGFEPMLEHAVMAAGHPITPTLGEEYEVHLAEHDQMLPAATAAGWGDRLKAHMAATLALMQQDVEYAATLEQAQAPGGPGVGGGMPRLMAPGAPAGPGFPGMPPGPGSGLPPGGGR